MVGLLKSRNGYSLMELMMVIAIIAIVAFFGPEFFKQTSRFFILSRARTEIQMEARAAISIIARDLRQAVSSSITISKNSGHPPYSLISFQTIDGRTVSYGQSGNRLIMRFGTKTRTLSQNCRYLAFSFPRSDDMTIVSVAMTLEKQIYQGLTKALHMASEKVRVMN